MVKKGVFFCLFFILFCFVLFCFEKVSLIPCDKWVKWKCVLKIIKNRGGALWVNMVTVARTLAQLDSCFHIWCNRVPFKIIKTKNWPDLNWARNLSWKIFDMKQEFCHHSQRWCSCLTSVWTRSKLFLFVTIDVALQTFLTKWFYLIFIKYCVL